MTTISSRDFNQDTSLAKRAAMDGPVFITDRGRPAHVLMSIEEYTRLAVSQNIIDMLACPEAADFDFEPVRMQRVLTPVEFD